jgi:hypothetical protein
MVSNLNYIDTEAPIIFFFVEGAWMGVDRICLRKHFVSCLPKKCNAQIVPLYNLCLFWTK